MSVCQGCKHWARLDPTHQDFMRPDFGKCGCFKLAYTLDEQMVEPDFLCYDSDYSGPYVALYTGERFGCVHFKKKNKGAGIRRVRNESNDKAC